MVYTGKCRAVGWWTPTTGPMDHEGQEDGDSGTTSFVRKLNTPPLGHQTIREEGHLSHLPPPVEAVMNTVMAFPASTVAPVLIVTPPEMPAGLTPHAATRLGGRSYTITWMPLRQRLLSISDSTFSHFPPARPHPILGM